MLAKRRSSDGPTTEADVFNESVDLRPKRCDVLEFDVLLVSHLNQEGFHARETSSNRLDDGGDYGQIGSTMFMILF